MDNLFELELLKILPSSISDDANVQAIAKTLDPELQSVSRDIREALIISRIDELPESVIDLLAWQWHVDFYEPDFPLDVKRTLVKISIPWHRKKGTLWAVKKVLEDLGFVPTVTEWFDLPAGAKPHTFSVRGHYADDPSNIYFLGHETEKLLIAAIWAAKPTRSGLLYLAVAPPPPDRTDHICRWDYCTWDHGIRRAYIWGGGEVDLGLFPEGESILAIANTTLTHGAYTRGRTWDAAIWGYGDYIGVREQVCASTHSAMIAERDDILSVAPARRKWTERRTWRGGGTWKTREQSDGVSTDIYFTEME
jgi:phage tail P2-like protein